MSSLKKKLKKLSDHHWLVVDMTSSVQSYCLLDIGPMKIRSAKCNGADGYRHAWLDEYDVDLPMAGLMSMMSICPWLAR